MSEIRFPFANFPFFHERRPLCIKGEAQCRSLSIQPSGAGEPGQVIWQITGVSFEAGRRGKASLDWSSASDWLKQDFERWLRGKHGLRIAQMFREAHPPMTKERK